MLDKPREYGKIGLSKSINMRGARFIYSHYQMGKRPPIAHTRSLVDLDNQTGLGGFCFMENWKSIPGFDGYEVSDLGNVRSYKVRGGWGRLGKHPRLLKPGRHPSGYASVSLSVDGTSTQHRIFRLVLLAFVGERQDGMEGCHNDSDPANDRLDNLRYDTHANNMRDRCKLTDDQVIDMRNARATGERRKTLAQRFGITAKQVSAICTGARLAGVGGKITMGRINGGKLNAGDVREIRRLHFETGETLKKIGERYCVTEGHVSRIVNRKVWAHVDK